MEPPWAIRGLPTSNIRVPHGLFTGDPLGTHVLPVAYPRATCGLRTGSRWDTDRLSVDFPWDARGMPMGYAPGTHTRCVCATDKLLIAYLRTTNWRL